MGHTAKAVEIGHSLRPASALFIQASHRTHRRGEANKAFEWLDRSYAQRDSGLQWIKTARFAAMLRKMNLS